MSDDSDISSKRNRKKRKPLQIEDSSSDSSTEIVATRKKRRKHKNYIKESDSDSDSSLNVVYRKTRVYRITSDSDSTSTDSEYESDWVSEQEAVAASKLPDDKPKSNENDAGNSDSSDPDSDRCPICLLSFKSQEVGSPESCDHSFCIDCIVEWSKNVNTCPVDRHPYNLILVRDNYDGKVIKQIPVEPVTQQQNDVDEIVEDPTFCEICGRSDAEDRMLLCDGCDLGFHLECLDPPLQEVPAGIWYCRECGPELVSDDPMVDVYEVHLLVEDAETLGWHTRPQRRNLTTPRLVPRTRQSERVRARIITRRSQRLDRQQDEAPRGGDGSFNQPGPSNSITRNASTARARSTKKPKRKRKKTKRKQKPNIKVTYEIDETTGRKIAIETKIQRRYKTTRQRNMAKRERMRRMAQPKTVKKRLAVQLGMCPPRQVGQTLPDVRIPNNPNTINFQRSQAGIPALHLFGRRNELDYFSQSESDGDINGGVNVLISRRPHPSDAALLRRAIRRKAVLSTPASSTPNILDSILDSQSKLHSKNSVMSLNKDGTVKIDKNDLANNNRPLENNRNLNANSRDLSSDRRRVNLNSFSSSFRQTPMYGNGDRNSTNPMYMSSSSYSRTLGSENLDAVTTSSGAAMSHSQGPEEDESEQSYSVQPACSSYDSESDSKKDKDKEKSRSGTPGTHSDSELDIYSDIETVSTSRAEESDIRPPTPPQALTPNTLTDEDANNSDVDLVIDTEKVDDKFDDSKEQVTSTVDLAVPVATLESNSLQTPHSTSDIQNEMVHSSENKIRGRKDVDKDDDEDSEDGCPNFSIYSTESINLAKTTDLQLLTDSAAARNDDNEVGSTKTPGRSGVQSCLNVVEARDAKNTHGGLYSDDEDETLIKIDHAREMKSPQEETANEDKSNEKPFGIGDISNMTEDISEEERSYTPCLDERASSQKQGLEGLDTELISDEERNDFDESHELKTASDGDALEINAKESELDFSKPEDYEEGEIIDKLKAKKAEETKNATEKEEEKPDDKSNKENKENENLSFKKLSKNNKERNYRDKDKEKERDRSKSREKKDRDKENRKERKREKRKEIERYNVRSIIAEKPRRMKDKFGRDEQRKKSVSRSKSSRSPSCTRRSCSRERRATSRERVQKFRGRRSRTRRSLSRSKSPDKRRSRSKIKKHRSLSRNKTKPRRKSGTGTGTKHKRKVSRTRHKSLSPRRRRDWVGGRRQSRGWSRSTHSYTPEQRLTPSWTPPRVMQPQPVVKPHNLTVILNNDINKKKKEKKKKLEKRKEIEKGKKRRREKTPPPSKEVFASGNNILVSVSFNKDTNERDVTKRKRTSADEITTKRTRKEKEKRKSDERRKKKNKDLAAIKPVAIIDLERSPFREITPSPQDVIVLSDSENCESNDMMGLQKVMCDSSQQVASPERSVNTSYLTGPKTPPEPQVKFSLNAQQPKIRAISNPLHEPDDVEVEIDPQEELEQRLNDTLHKGPNTPPEPPISPPSSPDAYDPFDPTKSRSPTPQPLSQTVQSSTSQNDITRDESLMDSRNDDDLSEIVNTKSHTPPVIADIQPADSQSNIKATTPEKSPEHTISVIINQVVQSQASIFPTVTSKPSYSTNTLITSTPINLTAPRINILNSTILTPPNIASAVPQRIVLPNTTKSSPVKVSPNKLPIKSTPIKPMPAKNIVSKSKPSRKSNEKEVVDVTLDFDSPYSPGSNDYEDLFEPPTDSVKTSSKPSSKNTKSPTKGASTFDVLFGTSPVNNSFKSKGKAKPTKYKKNSKGTKQIGVKIDEDTLKILDELPNSAVEMQVKDKFVDEWVLSHGPAACNTEKLQYLKKLNRQERVVEEVKLVLKPHYNKKHINKEEYKDILRRSVPKICHNKSGEINPKKIQNLIEAYVKKIRHSKKVTSSSSVNNPQKI